MKVVLQVIVSNQLSANCLVPSWSTAAQLVKLVLAGWLHQKVAMASQEGHYIYFWILLKNNDNVCIIDTKADQIKCGVAFDTWY